MNFLLFLYPSKVCLSIINFDIRIASFEIRSLFKALVLPPTTTITDVPAAAAHCMFNVWWLSDFGAGSRSLLVSRLISAVGRSIYSIRFYLSRVLTLCKNPRDLFREINNKKKEVRPLFFVFFNPHLMDLIWDKYFFILLNVKMLILSNLHEMSSVMSKPKYIQALLFFFLFFFQSVRSTLIHWHSSIRCTGLSLILI